MPVYEYECRKCGHVTELLRSMSAADEKTPCESCGSDQTSRMHSVFSAAAGVSKSSPCGDGACQLPQGGCGMGGGMPSPGGCGGGMCGL